MTDPIDQLFDDGRDDIPAPPPSKKRRNLWGGTVDADEKPGKEKTPKALRSTPTPHVSSVFMEFMTPPKVSSAAKGSSKAAHFTWFTRMCRFSGLMRACSTGASKK